MKNLKTLSVSYNELDSLPDELGGLTSLEQLWLDQNQLTYLPNTIGDLENLKTLELQYNWLESIPSELGNCAKLEFLHLDRNDLDSIPATLGSLRQLRELHLVNAGNLLNVPEELCQLRLLELIEIDGTTALPACMYVLQANRLQIVRR